MKNNMYAYKIYASWVVLLMTHLVDVSCGGPRAGPTDWVLDELQHDMAVCSCCSPSLGRCVPTRVSVLLTLPPSLASLASLRLRELLGPPDGPHTPEVRCQKLGPILLRLLGLTAEHACSPCSHADGTTHNVFVSKTWQSSQVTPNTFRCNQSLARQVTRLRATPMIREKIHLRPIVDWMRRRRHRCRRHAALAPFHECTLWAIRARTGRRGGN